VQLPDDEGADVDDDDHKKRKNKELGAVVEAVKFKLHPTFFPDKVTVDRPPYVLERRGWGTFEVGITIHWRQELEHRPSHFTHELDFSCAENSRIVAVE
jgi:transcription initiation factor IIF auxiliary subunit